ncbi:MAB_1171c family putative transporter [Streptomyces sp. BRA346]|uniref:MAB_1171c family putative transporter n=1 Tax=Streptomyces sp. BRA346 TaxID=2878199 RepID=UPI0040640512
MTTLLHSLCLTVGTMVFAWKVRGLIHRPRELGSVAFCVYAGLSAFGYLVLLPPVYVVVDKLTGIPNSSGMLSAVSVLGLTAAQQVLLMRWAYPDAQARPRIRSRMLFWFLMFAVYLTMFFLFMPGEQRFHDFYVRYSLHLGQAPYLSVYIIACIVGQLDVVRHCWMYARIADLPWLRRGMLTTTVGASTILLYCAIRVADILAGPLHADLRSLDGIAWACGDLGSALALIGWVLPSAGGRLSAVGTWVRDYHRHNSLYPLWKALHEAVPCVALDPPRSRLRDVLRIRNINFWLYRRVIEIQDAQRALRPRIESALEGIDQGRDAPSASADERLPMALAAARLQAARRVREATADGTEDGDAPAEARSTDLSGEVAWLTEVSRAFMAHYRGSSGGRRPGDPVRTSRLFDRS